MEHVCGRTSGANTTKHWDRREMYSRYPQTARHSQRAATAATHGVHVRRVDMGNYRMLNTLQPGPRRCISGSAHVGNKNSSFSGSSDEMDARFFTLPVSQNQRNSRQGGHNGGARNGNNRFNGNSQQNNKGNKRGYENNNNNSRFSKGNSNFKDFRDAAKSFQSSFGNGNGNQRGNFNNNNNNNNSNNNRYHKERTHESDAPAKNPFVPPVYKSPFAEWTPSEIEKLLAERPLTLGYLISLQREPKKLDLKTGDYVELSQPFNSDARSGIFLKGQTSGVLDHHGTVARYADIRIRFAIPNFCKVMEDQYNDESASMTSHSGLSHTLPFYRRLAVHAGISPTILPKITLLNAETGKLLAEIITRDEELYEKIGPGKPVDLDEAAAYLFETESPTMQQKYAAHKLLGFSKRFLMLPTFSGANAIGTWASLPKAQWDQVQYMQDQLVKWKRFAAKNMSDSIIDHEVPTDEDHSAIQFGKKLGLAYRYQVGKAIEEKAEGKENVINEDVLKAIKNSPAPDITFDSVSDKFYIDAILASAASNHSFTNPMTVLCNELIRRSIQGVKIFNDPSRDVNTTTIEGQSTRKDYQEQFFRSGIVPPDYELGAGVMGWNPAACKLASLPSIHPDMKDVVNLVSNISKDFKDRYLDTGVVEGVTKISGHVVTYSEELKGEGKTDLVQASEPDMSDISKTKSEDLEESLARARKLLRNESFSYVSEEEKRSSDGCENIRENFDLPVYVIDDISAKELDDGISVDGDWVHLHIADPTYYIRPGSDGALLGEYRASSTYTQLTHYPMVPESVSRTANLQRGPAMTISVKIGSDGNICDIKIRPTWIKNVRILNYSEVNTILDWSETYGISSPGPQWLQVVNKRLGINMERIKQVPPSPNLTEKDTKDLRHLQNLVKRHMKMRIKNGAFMLLESSGFMSFREDISYAGFNPIPGTRKPFQLKFSDRTMMPMSPSMCLVAECMIIGNVATAEYLHSHKIPAIYRGFKLDDDSPDSESFRLFKQIQETKDPQNGTITSTDIPMSLISTVDYTPKPCEHIALGVKAYTRVTSPLRRFSDATIHYNLKSYLLGERYVFEESSLEKLARKFVAIDRQTRNLALTSRYFWGTEYARRLDYYTSIGKLDEYIPQSADVIIATTKPTGLTTNSSATLPEALAGSASGSNVPSLVTPDGQPDGFLPYCFGNVDSPFGGRYVHDILVIDRIPDSDLMYQAVMIGLSSLNVQLQSYRRLERGEVVKAVMRKTDPRNLALSAMTYEDYNNSKALQRTV